MLTEHTYCASRGLCDTSTGVCDCFSQFDGANCAMTGVVWSTSSSDILLLHSLLDTFDGSVLHMVTERPASSAFYWMYLESDDMPTLTIAGDGRTTLYKVRSASAL